MQKNRLGQSSVHVSNLTLGCMSLGTDPDNVASLIDQALDAGINHLDTADLYDFGMNETLIGDAIHERRKDIVLTSKVGNHFDATKKDWFWDPSKDHIKNGLKESLRRLQTDYLDVYMLHGGTIDDPIDESIAAFEELKEEGLILAYGISSIRSNVIREYVQRSNMDVVMMQYSLLDRRPEEAMLDLLHEHNISVLARGPLAKGILADGGSRQLDAKAQDGLLGYSYPELEMIHEELSRIGGFGNTRNELALKYVLRHPAVASAVFGASSPEQIKANTDWKTEEPLSKDLYHQLAGLTKPIQYTNHR
ncbi:Pyridoxine 4-dehydrogenase [Lentibacillus sp. JNUCC-1]|uniref:aldo/keto reductase n=1 Tax=Lentibacillus sp. JNUCC-1 TaxID=2654513 RepID=UPI0012E80CE2|nr:aldo/keto reductase [Lentibacillus sp. JNUCC-1]MUV39714.1 Pyridoxine 4-dehydrogenase [Lentibacillus sp. JNUCC-1]